MERAKPFKIILILAVIIFGGFCLLLPEEKIVPTASMSGIIHDNRCAQDSLSTFSTDISDLK